MMHKMIVINPGSTSTKLAYFEDVEKIWQETINYSTDTIQKFDKILDQLELRRDDIKALLDNKGIKIKDLTAVIARGGPFRPLNSGTYKITQHLIDDILHDRLQFEHASTLASVIAFEIAVEAGIPSFFVDPVSVDELEPLARVAGIPELERRSLLHALNLKATARKTAERLEQPLTELNLVVAHLGGGISICAIQKGLIIDVNNAVEEGPFTPERSGSLPMNSFVKLIFENHWTYEQTKKRLVGQGGLVAHLGTNDARLVEERIKNGDKEAETVYEAMAYQISKEIGAMGTVLKGNVDGIVITGSLAFSEMLLSWIKTRVRYIAPVFVFPGENEMQALADGTFRVLTNQEKPRNY